VPRAKPELAKHCTAITITPEGDSLHHDGSLQRHARTEANENDVGAIFGLVRPGGTVEWFWGRDGKLLCAVRSGNNGQEQQNGCNGYSRKSARVLAYWGLESWTRQQKCLLHKVRKS
jgi:hypothetical protein